MTVTATYRGLSTGRRRDVFTLDVSLLFNLSPYTLPEAEMAKNLDKLTKAVVEVSDLLKRQADAREVIKPPDPLIPGR